MEVFGPGEILADKTGADDMAIAYDQTTVSLVMKEQLTESGDDSGVEEPREDCQTNHDPQCRQELLHVSPYAQPSA